MYLNNFDIQERVSQRAYRLWLEAGRPSDRGVEHWNRAEEMLAEEDESPAPRPGLLPAAAE
jgi:hypothetical protein